MPKKVVIAQGDSVTKLAERYGLFCRTIWEHADNAPLRAKREHMNVLMPGDELFIPDRAPKQVTAKTGAVHTFRRRGVPALFRLQVFQNDEPCKDQPYRLVVDGQLHEGSTDGAGVVEVHLPTNASQGTLSLPDARMELELRFGHLDPSAEPSGVEKRLQNLGFYQGRPGAKRALVEALLAFQVRYGLPETGEADAATVDRLRQVHDRVNDDVGGAAR